MRKIAVKSLPLEDTHSSLTTINQDFYHKLGEPVCNGECIEDHSTSVIQTLFSGKPRHTSQTCVVTTLSC